MRKKPYIQHEHVDVSDSAGETVLREERKKRRLTQEELAERAMISLPWIKQIEAGKERPGADARKRIRAVLEQCPVHADFNISCNHRLPVPPDEMLYSKRPSVLREDR